jgi:hypothetical protein
MLKVTESISIRKLLFHQFKSRCEAKQRKKKIVERIDKKKEILNYVILSGLI